MYRLGPPVLILLLAATFLSPAAGAAESVSGPYVAHGYHILGAQSTFLLTGDRDLDGDGQDDIPDVGGAVLVAAQSYVNAIVSANDDLYGSYASINACFYNPAGEDPYRSCTGTDCGSVALLGTPFHTDTAVVYAPNIFVDDALDMCGASTGTVTADFF